jgi:hypothetical protein
MSMPYARLGRLESDRSELSAAELEKWPDRHEYESLRQWVDEQEPPATEWDAGMIVIAAMLVSVSTVIVTAFLTWLF